MSWIHTKCECDQDMSIERIESNEYRLTVYGPRLCYDLVMEVGDLDFVHMQMVAINWGFSDPPEFP